MDPMLREFLGRESERLGTPLSEGALQQLASYLQLLLQWNERINLTAIVEPAAVVEKHFLDSLALAPLVDGATLVDVGAGAGFPGAVVAIARPQVKVTCIDSVQKKAAFLSTLSRSLKLSVNALCVRDERLVAEGRSFDNVVSRATFAPQDWIDRGAGLVSPHGRLFAMQGKDQTDLISPAGFVEESPVDYLVAGGERRIRRYRRV